MKYLIESNPAFLLLEVESGEYVFYNSLQHVGARLSMLEVQILDMMYTYQDKEYILSKFTGRQYELINDAISSIDKHGLLKCEEIINKHKLANVYPTSYYIHLTYRCNLKCSYCYNKSIRKDLLQDLSIDNWKRIIDKILPYANRIIFTGGECLLYKGISELLSYIKAQKDDIVIAAISNGMHDFSELDKAHIFTHISELSLSCDSLYHEGQRFGFNPDLFRLNIEWIKNNYPNISVSLASVYTNENSSEIKKTEIFCHEHKLSFSKTMLIPSNAAEVDLMPTMVEMEEDMKPIRNRVRQIKLNAPCFSCGAGKSICSIAPNGDVYPCQSLHYPEFNMGNILKVPIEELNRKIELITVDQISVCSRCNVKFICGGGCPATGYSMYGHRLDRNHLTCALNRHNAIEKLKMLDNRIHK